MAEKRRIPRCGRCTWYERCFTNSHYGLCHFANDPEFFVSCNRACCVAFKPDLTEQRRAARAHEVSPSCAEQNK